MLSSPTAWSFSRAPRHGFTLVELLVVIGIVAILTSLVVVNIPKVVLGSKQSQAIANLRRISDGIGSYVADNSGTYPFSAYNVSGGTPTNLWTTSVLPYLPEKNTVVNVGSKDRPISSVYVSPLLAKDKHHPTADFGVNGAVLLRQSATASANQTGPLPSMLSSVPRPSQTALVMTAQDENGAGSWYVGSSSYMGNLDYQMRPSDHGTKSIIITFADGHTQIIPFDQFVADRRTYLLPNP